MAACRVNGAELRGSGGRYEVVGRMDLGTVPALWRCAVPLLDSDTSALCRIDVSGTESMDSAGVAFLLALMRRARGHGRRVVAAGLSDRNQALVTSVGLAAVFSDTSG